ncbi:MAG: Kef family K(+) transporter [Candidatus Dactylopiibacterium carminicum]|uniref:Kef family K(+) transporter n=1 Tax=Candidatus Dactylopiibacterium carminicum TaxID=857335 RepID=A0A272EX91_9RHOO|nr:YbaL family putative K(+) efflux transporter [Candidatus Dactylopiibacterium carminicum]KAF7600290.1 Kef family K(+) transporter [Candidatus Dactylopiibacterium carminicum]PAS94656.1 MAG: Kef family K(+) transporter [Candidatus Dactylopiibacterium carminicum]PAS96943.1 MAG: Kef family K(+) transporter [Candidatus Dactylopiibacterium carminicum]PAT00291.1 MAG: sodium:proton antiporter [Candidatus Dactylopiibacterium carminicum]
MDHNIPLITTLAAGFGIALILGFIAERIKVPALVGYLLAGIIIGPSTPGFVADVHLASQLSEIGVMLLMFGVGLHFSLGDLLAVKRIAIPGAVAQMGLATILGMGVSMWWGWHWGSALIFGLTLSCASTVVLLKALEARGVLDTMNGRIAVGWLVVEDLATVLFLVLLPPLAGVLGNGEAATEAAAAATEGGSLWATIGWTLLQVSAFIALMLIAGRRVLPWLLWQISRTGSRELFTLSVIAAAIGIAYGAALLFSVSFALGAFFAGMVMRESQFSHRAAEESLPLRDAFSVLFFVSVGMLFEPSILIEQPVHLLGVVLIIMFGKSIAALALVLAFRYPLNTALTVSASLAQIGEFSFILAGLGLSLGLLPTEGMNLVLAGALISIALNPVLFAAIEPVRAWILRRSDLARRLEQRSDPYAELPMSTERKYLEGQVVVVGYGRVGKRIVKALEAQGIPYVLVEQIREQVEGLREKDIKAVSGNAADPIVLVQAHIAKAAMLVVAAYDPLRVRQMVETARTLNPEIEIVLRTHSEEESAMLRKDGLGTVFYGEEELAKGMTGHILERFSPATAATHGHA